MIAISGLNFRSVPCTLSMNLSLLSASKYSNRSMISWTNSLRSSTDAMRLLFISLIVKWLGPLYSDFVLVKFYIHSLSNKTATAIMRASTSIGVSILTNAVWIPCIFVKSAYELIDFFVTILCYFPMDSASSNTIVEIRFARYNKVIHRHPPLLSW